MTQILLALAGAAIISFGAYLARERVGGWGFLLAIFRTVGLGALLLLLINPQFLRRAVSGPPTVLLDASLSMGDDADRWQGALDSALSLAGSDGTILRFGSTVSLFDTTTPDQGATRLRDALLAGVGGGGPTIVVTDGEVGDAAAIPASLLARAGVVHLARDTIADVALLDVSVPEFVGSGDSIRVQLTVGAWGLIDAASGTLEVRRGDDQISSHIVEIPPSPGVARRNVSIPPNSLENGINVLSFTLTTDGDAEVRDDERIRIVSVTDEPDIVVLVAPADWEGRFLFTEVARMVRTGVRGFALVQNDTWIDMRTSERVSGAEVARVARGASVVLSRGQHSVQVRGKPRWEWPAGADTTLELFAGDWYPALTDLSSPIAGRLTGVAWDSVPPLTGVVPLIPTADEWVGLTSRQGRRGAERPVVMGVDSAGVHRLTTVGLGLWRWAFRGGESLEAYRALISAGIDWLLGAEVLRRESPVTIASVVKRGEPVIVSWHSDSIPTDVPIFLTGVDSTWAISVPIDANGNGSFLLPPGTFTWSSSVSRVSNGVFVVESYSDEYPPGRVTLAATPNLVGENFEESGLRDLWWLFALLIFAFAGEWFVRQKRGLP
jgi:hypothetical protein